MSSSFLFLLVTLLLLLLRPTRQDRRTLTPPEEAQVEHFRQYLRINTAHPSPDYASAVAFLSALAASLGLPPSRSIALGPSRPIFLLTYPGSDPSLPALLLTSHLDSVPPGDPARWTHPPFSAARDDLGRVYARGAQDDKCLAVQHLHALAALLARGFLPLRTVHVSVVPEEEVGGADGMARLVESPEFAAMNVGFALDEGQASPAAEFRVFRGDRVPWWVVVRARGEPRHGAWMGEGAAAENLMDAVEAVLRFREEEFGRVKAGESDAAEVVSVNLVYAKAGTPSPKGFVMNMQPSEAEVGFDMRLPPFVDPDEMRKRIAEWAPSTKNLTYEIFEKGPMRDHAGHLLITETNESSMWWVAFKEAIQAAGGRLAKPEILRSTTDARYLRLKGIPTLGFSPMSNTPILLHEHNEFLQDTVFINGIKVYEHIIEALSSLPDASPVTAQA